MRPDLISVPVSPMIPRVTVFVLVFPLATTFTVEVPLAVVTAAVGTYSASAIELAVMIETSAVCPRRNPAGIASRLIVVA